MRAWAVILFALSMPALAHDADVVYARLEQDGDALLEIVTLTNATLGLLIPLEGELLTQAMLDAKAPAILAGVWSDLPLTASGVPCVRSAEAARLDDGFITLSARWTCSEGALRQDFKILRILPTNYRVVLGSQLMGERGRQFAQGVFTALEIPRPKPPAVFDAHRVQEGFRRGLSDSVTLEVLLLLASCVVGLRDRRRLGGRLGLLLAGAGVTCAWRIDPRVSAAGVALSAVILAAGGDRPWSAAGVLVAGAAIGARAGVWSVGDGAGWFGGLGAVLVVLAIAGWPISGLLLRRPNALRLTRIVTAVLVCFLAGLRSAR